MSRIQGLLSKTADVYRRATASSKNEYGASAVATSVPVRLEPLDADDVLLADGGLTRNYRLYAELDANIQETDKLVIDSVSYYAQGIQKFDFGLKHLEIMVKEVKSE